MIKYYQKREYGVTNHFNVKFSKQFCGSTFVLIWNNWNQKINYRIGVKKNNRVIVPNVLLQNDIQHNFYVFKIWTYLEPKWCKIVLFIYSYYNFVVGSVVMMIFFYFETISKCLTPSIDSIVIIKKKTKTYTCLFTSVDMVEKSFQLP